MKAKPINQLKTIGTIDNYEIKGQASKSGTTKWIKAIRNGLDFTNEFAEKKNLKINKTGFIQFCGNYKRIIELLSIEDLSSAYYQVRFNQ